MSNEMAIFLDILNISYLVIFKLLFQIKLILKNKRLFLQEKRPLLSNEELIIWRSLRLDLGG